MIDFFWNSAHSVMDISVLLRDWQSGASQPKRNCLTSPAGGSPGKKGRLFRNKLEIESFLLSTASVAPVLWCNKTSVFWKMGICPLSSSTALKCPVSEPLFLFQ